MNKPLISAIVPMKNESLGLSAFFDRLIPILEPLGSFEIICVDDGSTDRTAELIRSKNAIDPRIKMLSLSRNFGKEAALTAGLHFAEGDIVIPIDADLQDPPELIPEMFEQWKKGYKVVLATRRTRNEDWLKRNTAGAFYNIINRFSTIKIPKNTGDFRLMDREVVENVKLLAERTRFMKGLFAWTGFKTTTVYFDRPERFSGKTNWNYWSLWKFALDGIFSFTTFPLKIWSYIGFFISVIAFLYGSVLIVKTLLYGTDVPGYASLMTVILFLGGIQLLSLGIIGEYVGRIYRETKQRPNYIIQDKIGFNNG